MSQMFLNRQVRMALYSLKRLYGGPVVLYHLVQAEVNPLTGEPDFQTRAVRVRRAIILPAKLSRDVERNISIISSNKQMVMGGTHDSASRVFIIERRDVSGWNLVKDDWIAYNGQRYSIETIEEYEFTSAWIVSAKHQPGEVEPLTLTQPLDADTEVSLTDRADGGL